MFKVMLSQTVLLPLAARAVNIIQGNDDGWAEINIRVLHNALIGAGYNAIVSAPAINLSGTVVGGCEFSSCPAGSPAIGNNASQPRLNYVNSCPATAMRKGIEEIALPFFNNSTPDIALMGPNVGANTGLSVLFSGTVGGAVKAVSKGVPALAFSGESGEQTAWNVSPTPMYSKVYADLAWNVTERIIRSGMPYMPPGIFLNVNFASVNETKCADASQFKYVLSRISDELSKGDDVVTCNNGGRLPSEKSVLAASDGSSQCLASISVGDASSKQDANSTMQMAMLSKLGGFLSCLPSS